MANHLPFEKKVFAVHALAEGNSIRSIERMTGINRNTMMGLGVRTGQACNTLLDSLMRDLPCQNIQVDEAWGFIGKKAKHASAEDRSNGLGDVWTFIALDRDSK